MSEQSKVTGGEWRLVNADHAEEIDIYSGGRYIASIPVSGVPHIAEEDRANAHLLAASKDMKEALEEALKAIEWCEAELNALDTPNAGEYSFTDTIKQARAALAKADGGVE